jgi:hypothetical protein
MDVCDPYGAALTTPSLEGDAYWDLLTQTLKLKNYRPDPIALEQVDSCDVCKTAVEHGLRVTLVVKARGGAGDPSGPPTDLAQYQERLGKLITPYKYVSSVVVVEDEVDPFAAVPYEGTADDYLKELAAACEVAHARGMKCANAGVSSTALVFLLADYLIAFEQGPNAIDLVVAAAENPVVKASFKVWPPTTVAEIQAALSAKASELATAKKLLAGFRKARVDYANFHWLEKDLNTYVLLIAFMRSATSCNAVITDSIGVRAQSADETTFKMDQGKELGLPLVIWSSRPSDGTASLVDGAGALTPTGKAFEVMSTTAECDDD